MEITGVLDRDSYSALGIGRSLLKRSSILVLDEATASIDSATDNILQEIIRHEFKDCTVSHHCTESTVIDSDLVLSDGRVQEYDTPARLLERDDSSFSKLIKEYSLRSQSFNNLTNISPISDISS